ncbi:hypothetical protein [Pseudobacteroides cellulosolvens]|uniref:Uncharacterized protein n=1 Tax=Pseudobacteroides cellulosolvens ATCC 35603 = DSM 2933 TaxID=398512 RepID=A0A0L6JW14_9FIRM|nr:hypothetical protein [Pseudobacteroides cellulosolvens]KNY29800.1 hypothetical protein Bccel_5077 [Pseudobacteroides cellulosolvens ATCC 35603 = DSM 2933]
MKNSTFREQSLIKSNYDIFLVSLVSVVFTLLGMCSIDYIYIYGIPILFIPFIFTFMPFRKLKNGDERVKSLTYITSFTALMIFMSISAIACIWLHFNFNKHHIITISIDTIIENIFLGLGILFFAFSALFAFFRRRY